MEQKINKAKKHLIDLICEEAKNTIKKSKEKYGIAKIGWVDYLHGKNAVQHIFTSAYITVSGDVFLVESDDSEAAVNLKMKEVDSLDKLQLILDCLIKNL